MQLSIYHLHDRERTRARREPVSGSVVIGSDPECDIIIGDDERVSPRHVRIVVEGCLVEPITGVTLVDGQPIESPTAVRLGAKIQIGDTILKLREASHVVTETNPSPSRPNPVAGMTRNPPGPAGIPMMTPPAIRALASAEVTGPRRPAAIWRETLAADATEHVFLSTLRDQPTDTATRMVYADWLDQQDRSIEAAFVRLEFRSDDPAIVDVSSLDWRAITSRAAIEDCRVGEGDPEGPQCPARWDGLTAMRDERLRRCKVCERRVRFCGSIADATLAGRVGDRAVFDAALDDTLAYAAFHDRRLEVDNPDDVVSLPSIDTTPSVDESDDDAFFTLDDDAPRE